MPARHSQASRYLKRGLFDRLTRFGELEQRLSQLPTNKDRGDAFEVFAEAYLATQKVVQAREVWPFDSIPDKRKRRLRLDTGRDMGVDGVFETHSGEHCAYQVKFRANRPSLRWDELATFMGLTEKVSQRVLFTNCDALPAVMNDRADFYCIFPISPFSSVWPASPSAT